MKNAPIKRVSNYIEQGLEVELSTGVTLCASILYGYLYTSIDYAADGEQYEQTAYKPDCFTITSHQGEMPAFYTEEFETLQELANKMQKYNDLRKWKVMQE